MLARTRLIAESWDVGPDGYQVGRFPTRWLEWNDRFRDTVRHFWLGRPASRGDFARRFAASDDLFHHNRRLPTASVNFIAAHDGFTLADFTSYSKKYNHANGENNADGRDHEPSANHGAEGPSHDPAVQERRSQVRRALMATLLLAQGTPMINSGDDVLNSQSGNNNAWNQDNATGWLDWHRADHSFAQFVAELTQLRRREPLLRHARWYRPGEQAAQHPEEPTMQWLAPQGRELSAAEWHDPNPQALLCRIDAPLKHLSQALGGGQALGSAALLLAFNPESRPQNICLPAPAASTHWTLALDSSGTQGAGQPAQAACQVPPHSLLVLRATPIQPST